MKKYVYYKKSYVVCLMMITFLLGMLGGMHRKNVINTNDIIGYENTDSGLYLNMKNGTGYYLELENKTEFDFVIVSDVVQTDENMYNVTFINANGSTWNTLLYDGDIFIGEFYTIQYDIETNEVLKIRYENIDCWKNFKF